MSARHRAELHTLTAERMTDHQRWQRTLETMEKSRRVDRFICYVSGGIAGFGLGMVFSMWLFR